MLNAMNVRPETFKTSKSPSLVLFKWLESWLNVSIIDQHRPSIFHVWESQWLSSLKLCYYYVVQSSLLCTCKLRKTGETFLDILKAATTFSSTCFCHRTTLTWQPKLCRKLQRGLLSNHWQSKNFVLFRILESVHIKTKGPDSAVSRTLFFFNKQLFNKQPGLRLC